METILQTVIGVLIANKLLFVYQMWRVTRRYRAVAIYFQHVRLACRAALRLKLYKQGHRSPQSPNSRITAWHILISTPKDAVGMIEMHCDYILQQEVQMCSFGMHADVDTERAIAIIRDIREGSRLETDAECERLHWALEVLRERMKELSAVQERQYHRLTGENSLTIAIGRRFLAA